MPTGRRGRTAINAKRIETAHQARAARTVWGLVALVAAATIAGVLAPSASTKANRVVLAHPEWPIRIRDQQEV